MDSVADIQQTKVENLKAKTLAYIELTKPRIAFMLVLTSIAGFYLGSDAHFNWNTFLSSIVGITLLAFGVAALNQYIERKTDRLMKRTENRPLPSGRLNPAEGLAFGIILCLAAELFLAWQVNLLTAALGLIVIVGYVLLYTPLKTKTTASTAIGAIPGAMPPLMGFTAAANEVTLGAWSLFVILFLWQFPHFLAIAWMYREQYAQAGIKMLPVVDLSGRITAFQIVLFTVFLVPITFAPFFLGMSGMIYLIGSIVLGLWMLFASIQAARLKTTPAARSLLIVSVLYLPLLFALMVFNH